MIKKVVFISSILCFTYGIIMFFTNITKTFFLIWMFCSVILFFLYKMYQSRLIYNIPIIIRKLFFTLFILGFIVFVFFMIEIIAYYNKKPQKNLDYVIVLGALVTENGPAMSTIYRLDETINYLNDNSNTKCILTGGKGNNEPDYESVVMADYLIDHNIDKNRLYVEKESSSTYENLQNSKVFVDVENDTIGIVTNNFHVRRAMFLAEKLGYKYVDGLASYSLPINAFSNLCRETLAMIYYKVYFLLF